MKEKTKKDLKRLKEIQAESFKLFIEKKEIEDNCLHLDSKVALVETFAYEFTPKKVCVVCNKVIRDAEPTEEEVRKVFYDFFSEGEEELSISEEKLSEIVAQRGYNFPSVNIK